MRRATVLLALAVASSPAAAETWRTYANARFGATVEYPDRFSVRDEAPANGDGQRFRTPDGHATLAVYGFRNVLDETTGQMMEGRRQPGASYTLADAKPAFFALSGTRADRVSYVRCLRSRQDRDVFVCAELDYPAADARGFDPVVTRISRSLRAGETR